MEKNILSTCHFINYYNKSDDRGELTVIEKNIPFSIQRIYYLHKTKAGNRGFHAHKKLEQVIIAIHGSFTLKIDNGRNTETITMDDSAKGLYVCPMIWREISDFSADAVCLVLASQVYDEGDYIRNYEEFKNATT